MKKKKLENTILTLLGLGLIITSVILLLKRADDENDTDREFRHYLDYGDTGKGHHVFSETGILL